MNNKFISKIKENSDNIKKIYDRLDQKDNKRLIDIIKNNKTVHNKIKTLITEIGYGAASLDLLKNWVTKRYGDKFDKIDGLFKKTKNLKKRLKVVNKAIIERNSKNKRLLKENRDKIKKL